MMYVLSRTLGQSRLAGFASSLGLALGGVCLAVISATGLAVLFLESKLLFNFVAIVGALYLFYLAFDLARSAMQSKQALDETEVDKSVHGLPLVTIVRQGMLVEILNPKTILFFIAFLPGFVIEESGNVWLQMIVLGMLVPLTAIPSDIIVATAGGTLKGFFNNNTIASRVLEILGAVVLGLIALQVFLSLR